MPKGENCRITASMGSCKRTISHVVKFYVVVIGSQNFLEIRHEPSICVTAKYSLYLVFPGHETIVCVVCGRYRGVRRRLASDFSNLRTT